MSTILLIDDDEHLGPPLAQYFQRDSDAVARYGGEEFIVFLSADSESEFHAHLERLRQQIHESSDPVLAALLQELQAYPLPPASPPGRHVLPGFRRLWHLFWQGQDKAR